ncbi:hypothetical protein ACFSO0_14740 [Brevibacillus sp. GCM10020057]|uniref:hypothetical protein n=1 Tax=Brevibacillus sp. GCM10020057 TaxID=3317327 RepID=UPI003640C242
MRKWRGEQPPCEGGVELAFTDVLSTMQLPGNGCLRSSHCCRRGRYPPDVDKVNFYILAFFHDST